MSSRKIIQLITFIALLIGILWFIYKPDFEPALTCLLTAATLIGLIVEEKYFTTREVDKKLFEELKKTLPSDGSIAFIDQHNMAGWPFQWSQLKDIENFVNNWGDAEHEFLTKKIEVKRKALYEKCKEYLMLLAKESFPTNNPGLSSIPAEWEIEQPERFVKVVKQLHTMAGEIVELHQDLFRTARKILKC